MEPFCPAGTTERMGHRIYRVFKNRVAIWNVAGPGWLSWLHPTRSGLAQLLMDTPSQVEPGCLGGCLEMSFQASYFVALSYLSKATLHAHWKKLSYIAVHKETLLAFLTCPWKRPTLKLCRESFRPSIISKCLYTCI